MNIILSGPDSCGKTTLAEKLQKKYNMDIIHSTSKTRNDYDYHIDLIDYHDNTIFDRWSVGEMIFPFIYNREPKITTEEFYMTLNRVIENNDMYIIFICSDVEILNKRLIERNEIDYLNEINEQCRRYSEVASLMSNYFKDYKNFYICDIAKENAYDYLDRWIESRFNKKTVNVAYRQVCRDLIEKSHTMETKNIRGNTRELCNYTFTVEDISDPIISLKTGKCDYNYLAGEILWYWNSRNDVEFISKFGSMWSKLTDDGIHNNSAYGYILKEKHGFDQIEKIIELLKYDKYSRRAVLNINVPNENVIETKDEMCTICLIYQIRDNKLHCTCVMRSNDIRYGTRNDLGYFLTLQKYIADRLNVEYGTYTHFAASIHVYDRDYDYVKSVAYGDMSTTKDRLNIDLLLKNNDYLIDYVDNHWVDREHFTEELKKLGIISER